MGRGKAGGGSAAAASRASNGTATPLSKAEFASKAIAAARTVGPEGRFGDNKVFISAAYDAFARTPDGKGMTLDAFKRRLIEAHTSTFSNSRNWQPVRADLVEAMNPATVRRSEISHNGATFHLIRFQ